MSNPNARMRWLAGLFVACLGVTAMGAPQQSPATTGTLASAGAGSHPAGETASGSSHYRSKAPGHRAASESLAEPRPRTCWIQWVPAPCLDPLDRPRTRK